MARSINEVLEGVLTHTKTRNMYGLVIISCHTEKKKVRVVYAKEWSREKLNEIPYDIHSMYKKAKWDQLYIDQITGQHLIEPIKRLDVPVNVITTQKDLKDPKGIEDLEVMDKNEIIPLFMKLRQNKQIEFHSRPSKTLRELEEQMPLYLEHITEAGSVDYYAPGDEYDHLAKGLLMCCFAVRDILEGDDIGFVGGAAFAGKKPPGRGFGGSRSNHFTIRKKFTSDFKTDASIVRGLSGPTGRHTHYY